MSACVWRIYIFETILARKGRVWVVLRWRNKSEGVNAHICTRTRTQICYWRCKKKKNQCSGGKAFPLLVQGVRLLSVAFNYSFSSRPAEPHWFSFSPPLQRRRQIERLDLSIQSNTGRGNTDKSQSYFNGVLQKQIRNSHRSKFHSEGEQPCVKNTLWAETPGAMYKKFAFSNTDHWDGNSEMF